jgi:integrase
MGGYERVNWLIFLTRPECNTSACSKRRDQLPAHGLPSWRFSVKLTTTAIKTLALPPGVKDKTFWDDELGGFGLRLREGGSRNWVVQYDLAGKTKRVTLGTPALLDVGAARAEAKRLLASIRLGGDPAVDKRTRRAQAAETFCALLPRYLIANQSTWRPQSFRQVERRLQKLARPLHPLPLTAIDRRAISRLISDIAANNGPTAATNAHGTLSGYFSWLVREGLLEQNPMLNTNKPKPQPGRDYVPTEDELRTLWSALDAIGGDYADVVKLIILFGARRGEVGDLCWGEINLDAALIEIPAARMKGGRSHLIPLSSSALEILQRRPRNDREHVFGRGESGFRGWSRARETLDTHFGEPRQQWVLHDWRRKLSTVMHDQLGIQPHIVERCLAHVGHQAGVAGTYNKAEYMTEKRRALEHWAEWVDGVVTGKPAKAAKVVHLSKRR